MLTADESYRVGSTTTGRRSRSTRTCSGTSLRRTSGAGSHPRRARARARLTRSSHHPRREASCGSSGASTVSLLCPRCSLVGRAELSTSRGDGGGRNGAMACATATATATAAERVNQRNTARKGSRALWNTTDLSSPSQLRRISRHSTTTVTCGRSTSRPTPGSASTPSSGLPHAPGTAWPCGSTTWSVQPCPALA